VNSYKGCAYGILHGDGPSYLAHKLWQDRNVLVPRLAKDPGSGQALTARLTDLARQFFVSIEGVHNSISADQDQGWGEDTDIFYTLTALGNS
jgi:hypothetical protein